MKTRLLFVIALCFFIGYGCEQATSDEITTPVQKDDAPVMTKDDADLDAPVQAFPLEINETLKPLTLDDTPIIAPDENSEAILSRSDYGITIPSSILKFASCGTNTNQTLYDNANRISNSAYAHFGYTTDLNGRDEIYRITVSQSSIVTINLTNTTRNLAMVLFKGSINCTSIGTCNVSLSSVIDVTTSSSEYSDQIGPVQLSPGTYILVVDSKINQSSSYNLRVNCTPIYAGCVSGATRLLYDDFNNYQYGPLSHQSYYWLKWYSSATYDAEVAGSSSNKYMYMVRKSNATTSNQPAVLWRFGYRNTGSYALKMSMYVPSNRSAYFSIQKRLTYQNTNNEYGARLFLEAGGLGKVLIGGSTYTFSYPHNNWMNIQLNVNFNTNRTYLYINGVLKASWPCTSYSGGTNGTKAIEALQFYPHASNSQFYVDNICFSKYY